MTGSLREGASVMLNKTPFSAMSHAEWRAAMQKPISDVSHLKSQVGVDHVQTTALLVDSLARGTKGQATTPKWTSLLVLP